MLALQSQILVPKPKFVLGLNQALSPLSPCPPRNARGVGVTVVLFMFEENGTHYPKGLEVPYKAGELLQKMENLSCDCSGINSTRFKASLKDGPADGKERD
ncbi:hypothetical protein TNCV_4731291 [Trichonephila clavipes]|nr:hypothetical protein TNCV_4731291 [Trichonephila clavipes]